jgi:hypothetical protein
VVGGGVAGIKGEVVTLVAVAGVTGEMVSTGINLRKPMLIPVNSRRGVTMGSRR